MAKGLVSLVLIWSAQVFGAPNLSFFDYSLPGYPPTEAGCQAEAARIGTKLHEAAGVTIYKTFCDRVTPESFDLRVTYLAASELPRESTFDAQAISAQGTYASPETCQAALPSEVSHFEKAVGLKVFTAYCFHEDTDRVYSYVARLDAIGTATIHPFVGTTGTTQAPLDEPETIAQALLAGARSLGIDAAAAAVDREFGGSYRITLRYYSSAYLYFSVESFAHFHEEEARCQSREKDASEVLARAKQPPMAVFCSFPAFTGFYSDLMGIVLNPGHGITQEKAPDEFDSLEACEAGRDAVLRFYRETLHRDAFGALCTGAGRPYSVLVYENPPAGRP